MDDVEEILARIQAIVAEKSRQETSCNEKHGLVLYYYALFKIHGREQYLGQMRVHLQELIAALPGHDHQAHPVLSFPLIANLFEENLVDAGLTHAIGRLDQYLFGRATLLLKTNNTHFLSGALGIIHYFAERLPDPHIQGYLKLLLPAFYHAFETNYGPAGSQDTISLGLPDGLSGILLMLMKCYKQGILGEHGKRIIRDEILKIISSRLEVDFSREKYSVFPGKVNKWGEAVGLDNTLGWCCGDLNQSMVFHRAGQLFGDADLDQTSNLIGLNTLLRRSKDATNITDSRVSVGSSGLAETYRSLFGATRIDSYREGYAFWMNQSVTFLRAELATGYYAGKELDVLDGLVGAALPLLAHRSGNALKWSHCLLL